MVTRKDIINKVIEFRKRACVALDCNICLEVIFHEFIERVEEWSGDKDDINHFWSTYKISRLKEMASEVSVILDRYDKDYKKYSIEAVLEDIQKYIKQPEGAEKLFTLEGNITNALSYDGCYSLGISGESDQDIFYILDKQYKAFKKEHKQQIKDLKDVRNKYLSHPDVDGQGILPHANFFKEASVWFIAYTSLLLTLLSVEFGATSHEKESIERTSNSLRTKYRKFIQHIIGES